MWVGYKISVEAVAGMNTGAKICSLIFPTCFFNSAIFALISVSMSAKVILDLWLEVTMCTVIKVTLSDCSGRGDGGPQDSQLACGVYATMLMISHLGVCW